MVFVPKLIFHIYVFLFRNYNKSSNPIIHSLIDDQYELPLAVYAFIEKHHLGTGEETSTDRKLAEEIRNLGHKENEKPVDFCAHIIAPSLGGRMDKRNLIPLGRTENWDDYTVAERTIYDFIHKKQSQNGRAYLRIFIFYDDEQNPSCPTRMQFSYRLFADDKDGKQNVYSEIYFPVYVPGSGEISIEELTIEAARAETPYDRESERLIDKLEKENQPNENLKFWRDTTRTMEIVKSVTLGVLVLYLGYTLWINGQTCSEAA